FRYRDGHLYCEDVDLARVAEELGTPTYVYSAGTILDHYARLDTALQSLDHLICYAVKANSNRAILKLLADAGAGFDIVSGGELYRVLAAGGDPAKCTFAGVGKSREEIEYALEQGVYSFNVESEAELEQIDRIAGVKETRAPIALRVNPDVDPHTHEYISTGSRENKFGIALDQVAAVYQRAAKLRNIDIVGVQMHIGSQITEIKPFVEAIKKVAPLVRKLKSKFAIVDAGMNDLIRPALYHSYHEIVPVAEPKSVGEADSFPSGTNKIDIVGPVCESGDFFALDREMPEMNEGDLLAIMSAGAYG